MLLGLRDSRTAPFVGASDQQVDCILGPSRAALDPVDQWENEGGRVPSRSVDRCGEWNRSMQRAVETRVPLAVPSASTISSSSADLHACGRCHGPVSFGRYSLLGKLLSYCMAVEQYHCVDPSCGWSGIRMCSGLMSRPLLERRLR